MKFLLSLIAVLMVMVSPVFAADDTIAIERNGDKYELFIQKGKQKIHVNKDIELLNEPCIMWDRNHWYIVSVEKTRLIRIEKEKFALVGDIVSFKVNPTNGDIIEHFYDKNKFISEYKPVKKLTSLNIHQSVVYATDNAEMYKNHEYNEQLIVFMDDEFEEIGYIKFLGTVR